MFPAFVPEGVAAFTEPVKNRMVLPIDEPPDQLQGLITHEMVHAFAFDLIPRGIGFGISQSPIPLWVDEGLADYLRGIWEPLDLAGLVLGGFSQGSMAACNAVFTRGVPAMEPPT